MTGFVIVISAVVTAAVLIVGIWRFSAWQTSRKSIEDFKREREDASNVNGGGYMF